MQGFGVSMSEIVYKKHPDLTSYLIGSDGTIWRQLKPFRNRQYLQVDVSRACLQNKFKSVHHLVLEAFTGPRPVGAVCCHLNDEGDDNRIENLRWDTQRSNYADAVRNQRRPHKPTTDETKRRIGQSLKRNYSSTTHFQRLQRTATGRAVIETNRAQKKAQQ